MIPSFRRVFVPMPLSGIFKHKPLHTRGRICEHGPFGDHPASELLQQQPETFSVTEQWVDSSKVVACSRELALDD